MAAGVYPLSADRDLARIERDLVAITSVEAAAPAAEVARLVTELRSLHAAAGVGGWTPVAPQSSLTQPSGVRPT